MSLADDVAVLEAAQQNGTLKGRDLEVIEQQVARAEDKILRYTQGSALCPAPAGFLEANAA